MTASEAVRVVVRCRPMSSNEEKDGRAKVVQMDRQMGSVILHKPGAAASEPPKTFSFDAVFDETASQREIYDNAARRIVESVLEGYNGTVFAYGQTGTGKTFTMEGKQESKELRGIIPNAFEHIFGHISQETGNTQFLVRASYLEIYNEEIRDLLAKDSTKNLDLKENADHSVYVKDLTNYVVKGVEEIDHVMQKGKLNRTVGATKMNIESSRSHSIFCITIERSEKYPDGSEHIRMGKLNLVDLAGSERQSKTQATGERLKEATKINLSLSALGNVISALVESKTTHIPYRDSRLTRILQDSLGGNTKTVMVANCGPADYNYDETLSTLRYANRAKNIKNKPKINEDPKDAMLRQFQEEIERLKQELASRSDKIERGESDSNLKDLEKDVHAKSEAERAQLESEKAKTEEQKKKVEEELRKQKEKLAKEKAERESLNKKLHQLEAKLIVGGENILDKAALQEEALRRKEAEIEERRQQEQRLQRELEEKKELALMQEHNYASLQEEVEAKTKKLKKVYQKYQEAQSEIQDLQEEFQVEREDMLDTIRELARQLKLKNLIIENFIPPEEAQKIESRARWSDEHDEWLLARLELSGNNIPRPDSYDGSSRPMSEYARIAGSMADGNPRYKGKNVMQLDLDMPERTTLDYYAEAEQHGMMDPYMGTSDEYVSITQQEHQAPVYYSYNQREHADTESMVSRKERPRSSRPKSSKRPTTARRKAAVDMASEVAKLADSHIDDGSLYPEARGLLGSKRF